MDPEIYTNRRETFREVMGPGAVALFHAAPEARRNSDVHWKYRQTSDLLYLTGWAEPESCAIISNVHDDHGFVLVVRPRDRKQEIWSGRRHGPDGATGRFGADHAAEYGELDDTLFEYLQGAHTVYWAVGEDPAFDTRVFAAIRRVRKEERKGVTAPYRFVDPRHLLGEQRLVKSDGELAVVRQAVEISAAGHRLAMESCRPGMHEYELEALIEYEFRRAGANGFGYPTIVGAGANATILHYIDNTDAIGEDDLVLIDAGAEYGYYTGDITRTWPASGQWRPEQRKVYDLVLAAQLAAIDATRPGATIETVHEIARRTLVKGLVDLGLLAGDVDKLIADKEHERFYMHRTSHWLGMDVHDAGRYYESGTPRPMAPGMVLTVEPGIYIAEDDDEVPEAYRGLGVRIEDDVLVTDGDPEVLSASVPKDPDELSAIIGRKSRAA